MFPWREDQMSHLEFAREMFMSGCNCSQAVLSYFGPDMGMDRNTCCSIAAAFGGGIALSQRTCGAVTGAVMVIGLYSGAGISDIRERKKEAYRITEEFIRQFEERNNSIQCSDILGTDIETAGEQNLFQTRCAGFITDAIEILEKLVGEKTGEDIDGTKPGN